ncbi:alkaline phosphatase family protein [Thalassotalea fusca]
MKKIIAYAAICFSNLLFAKPITVLVSIDGFANYYLEKYQVPFIQTLVKNGASAEAMYPVYPSKTFPNHVSIVTGVYPSEHGILHNKFFHPDIGELYKLGAGKKDKRWLTAKPIWTIAEEQQKKAYLYFWPESEAISYEQKASYIEPYDHGRSNETRVSKVLDWICSTEDEVPDFVSLYFSSVDTAGHEHGQHSPELTKALTNVDNLLKQLINTSQQCKPNGVNFVIVSDHGMTPAGSSNAIYYEDIVKHHSSTVVNGQTQLFVYEKDRKKLNDVRSQLQNYLDNNKIKQFRIFQKGQFPEHWHLNPNLSATPDLIADALPPYTFANKGENVSVETHGFDATLDPNLHAIFIGYGPSFESGATVAGFQNIHITALLAHLIDVELPEEVDAKLDVFRPLLIE